ncbi:MAG: hypothetical protein JO351_11095 [Candidatus Eremiobacteraeota bacterium]|nr:hypothetical protein [Candidatus Eremiobacteraeota bacterium]
MGYHAQVCIFGIEAAPCSRYTYATMATSNAKTATHITHREFKLLLKAERFPTRRALLDFNKLLEDIAAKLHVRYEPFDPIDAQLRIVQFYDTSDQTLRKNRLIFRIRQLRQALWPDDSWEVTFKARHTDRSEAEDFDSTSSFPAQQKKKFKEEILRGDAPGTIASIYSNNCILESPQLDVELPLEKLAEAFPHLKSLDLNFDQTMTIVNSAKVFEIESKLGNLFFGHHTTATATLAVWARPVPDKFEPLIAEFGWSYHPVDDEKGKDADKVADQFFKDIQLPLKDWITTGTTKTALIYGDQGN